MAESRVRPGVMVDTLEVAGLWSALPRLYAGDPGRHGRALRGRGLSPVPPVSARLIAVLNVPGQRRL